jgi:hypothetical protein
VTTDAWALELIVAPGEVDGAAQPTHAATRTALPLVALTGWVHPFGQVIVADAAVSTQLTSRSP